MKTKFPKGTSKQLRRKYSRWKSKNWERWMFANLVLGEFGKRLP